MHYRSVRGCSCGVPSQTAKEVDEEMIFPLDYIPVLSIILSIPYVCYHDIKARIVSYKLLILLAVINIPVSILYLLESPVRNYYLIGFTLLFCGILIALALSGIIGGFDALFASEILLFVQFNPFKFPRVYFPMDFFWNMILLIIFTAVSFVLIKTLQGARFPRGVPFRLDTFIRLFEIKDIPQTLVIAAAFILTLVIELI